MDINSDAGVPRLKVQSWRSFWLVFPVLAAAIVVASWFVAQWRLERALDVMMMDERSAVQNYVDLVSDNLGQVSIDVCAFSEQNELHQYLENFDRTFLDRGSREFETRMRLSRAYDHIRFIDGDGTERVRVNFVDGRPMPVAEEDLQVKNRRYYFDDLALTERGHIYISPIDLNIENGNIEVPHKPVMRFGTPVFDDAGEQRGFFIVNVLAKPMLDAIIAQGDLHDGNPMLLNEDGYWLVDPTMPASWGFLYPAFVDERMPVVYPQEWARMQEAPAGSFRTEEGLFTYVTYHPLDEVRQCATDDTAVSAGPETYYWVLASHVPADVLGDAAWRIRRQVVIAALLAAALAGMTTRWATVTMAKRRHHRRLLEQRAVIDVLTGLANRAAFEDRLHQEVARADRQQTKFAVIMADLDGFKAVNDTLGHRAGDRVLRRVAEVLEGECRSTDVAARLGGDEFAVVLSGIADTRGAERVAASALERIQRIQEGTLRIGASFGIAIYPDDAADGQEIVSLADRAMYAAKNSGKNCVRTASEVPSDA
ncbi:sensor domain-containing diguanylate cyclase [Acuticoccus sp. I52.16.1]|uniref:sensor domain-containing diguanylate cyclase n=1 Tax=Acuticoccus sp. I52.16.1 TaxID=2928472 RepID=UPI001FCFEF75|nr:sensor domain-containing diguanylate cyclase [Acuticoccus sp. I52.16.1]UOM33121.1 sensor domain-containing diguanylate cyclase [Acuticoccus sp. I52.16.1]